jgi:cysteinyl-tRNA synthetase
MREIRRRRDTPYRSSIRRSSYRRCLGLETLEPRQMLTGDACTCEIGWDEVDNWLYQLQGYEESTLETIGDTTFDLIVMDYSQSGDESGEWTAEQIDALKQSTGGPKKVVSYLSIGEAEDYRFYWQQAWQPNNPSWIVSENPIWPGNFVVEFWNEQWQDIVFGYLDRIIDQGFDGAYLDLVDVHEQFNGRMDDMVDFVIEIATYARANSPLGNEFAIFPQNAENLADPDENPRWQEYLAAVNGLGKEETYFEATNAPTSSDDRMYTQINLDRFLTTGPWGFGLVLAVDYANQVAAIDEAYQLGTAKGYVSYVTHVDLDRITFNVNQYDPTVPECVESLRVLSVEINGGLSDPTDLSSGEAPAHWATQRSQLGQIRVAFSAPVTVNPSDVNVTNLGINAPQDADQVVVLTSDQIVATDDVVDFVFLQSPLDDGVYRLELAGSITDAAGNQLDGNGDGTAGDSFVFQGDAANKFFQLLAEWNGDGGVSVFDFTTFSYWFGQPIPIAPIYVDVNRDNGVSVFDFTGFSANFGKGVVYPATFAARATTATGNAVIQNDSFNRRHIERVADEARIDAVLTERLIQWNRWPSDLKIGEFGVADFDLNDLL